MATLAKPKDPESNPVINSPYEEPNWHWELDDQVRAIDNALEGRRPSQNIPPVVGQSTKNGRQGQLIPNRMTTDWDHLELVNAVREGVAKWQRAGYPGATDVTQRLLEHWNSNGGNIFEDGGLYYAQRDAALAHIYLVEAPRETPEREIVTDILGEALAPHLERMGNCERICHKMATGTGKTTVMAMLIAYYASNHAANPNDKRFTDRFLVICPNTTVRERLRPSLTPCPGGIHDDYFNRNLLPGPQDEYRDRLNAATVKIANWQSLLPKTYGEIFGGAALNVLRGRDPDANPNNQESVLEAVRRVASLASDKDRIIVINDEAHHAHYGNPDARQPQQPTKWLDVIASLKEAGQIHGRVIDLSATPTFPEAARKDLFPWIISDCGLIEAQEAGLTKIPRAPVSRDENRAGEFRNIFSHTPKQEQNRFRAGRNDNCRLLKEAIDITVEDYVDSVAEWRRQHGEDPTAAKLPAAIVVNTTANANALYDHIAGGNVQSAPVPGETGNPFSNYRETTGNREWHEGPPRTIVVHSDINERAISSSEMQRRFKELAERYRRYYDGLRAIDTDIDVIRAVMNSVGRPGEPGEDVRCVISVSMLTEGWDAKNVTHLIGFRPFKSSLLCEQVAGRTLRRSVWDPDDQGKLSPEYASVLEIRPETSAGEAEVILRAS